MTHILLGQIVSFGETSEQLIHDSRGAIAVGDDGRILFRGPLALLPRAFDHSPREDYGDHILMAGFIDAHIHFPQHRILAAAAMDLLDWLHRYTFPEEALYADAAHATAASEIFLNNLFAHGTTSALAFCSSHKTCAEALFTAAAKRNVALITGKTLMDRNAIPAVHDTVEQGALDTISLHEAFHGKGRLRHAVTPRFAITSTEAQLQSAGELLQICKGALMQTHISESAGEIAYVKQLFPNCEDYTAVYERFGLVTDRSLFAHGIHLSPRELAVLHEAQSTVVHCPTSNTFLGSGLMQFENRKLALATDIGGGTSYSMLQTMGEAYKVQMLLGRKLKAAELFFMSTLGNARALRIDDETGNLCLGKFADIIVLNPKATPVMAARHALSNSIEDVLFALALLGDDRSVAATYVAGTKVFSQFQTAGQ
jgi:guanine deaminase